MKEFKGTKQDWKYELKGYAYKDIGLSYSVFREEGHEIICEVKTDIGMQTDGEVLANAKAISQVPRMIKALQHSLRVAKLLDQDNIGVKRLVEDLEETLEKAL